MGKRRILVVDDEANIRETMQIALDAAGYQAVTAATGEEALEIFGTGKGWDLVVLDERLPGMDGLDVLTAMRTVVPKFRIVMVTAYATIELAVEAMKRGACDFLRKPFNPETLRQTVRQALERPDAPEAAPVTAAVRPSYVNPDLPLFSFVTLNGYQFWPVDLPEGGEETSAMRIRRAFEVKAPSGDLQRCAVELTTTVRQLVSDEAGRDIPPPDRLWDMIGKSALSEFLWQRAEMPPTVLTVFDLTDKQIQIVRSILGVGSRRRG